MDIILNKLKTERGFYKRSRFITWLNSNISNPGDFLLYNFQYSDKVPMSPQLEPTLFNSYKMFQQKGENDIIRSMATVIHETIHFTHDYLLGNEINRDMLFDELSYHITAYITKIKSLNESVLFPLSNISEFEKIDVIHHIIEQESRLYYTPLDVHITPA